MRGGAPLRIEGRPGGARLPEARTLTFPIKEGYGSGEGEGDRGLRYLIDILHPAHVHFFHHFIRGCEGSGHQVLITVRRKGLATDLLDGYGHPYLTLAAPRGKRVDLVWELLLGNMALSEIARGFRPHALLGVTGISIASVGKRLGIPAYVFCDTEGASVSNWLTFPRATEVITPRSFAKKVRGNHVTYPGYHELAYLHPRRFTPDPGIRGALGLAEGEGFSLVRFVSWGASYDFFRRGFTPEGKGRLVESLLRRRRVFVSSEGGLPRGMETLRLPVPPILIHHVLAAADLLVGESATMASEAAVLGVPSVLCSPVERGFTDEEERRYGLVMNTRREPEAILAAEEILDRPDRDAARGEWAERRGRLLAENVDVTGWIFEHLKVASGEPEPSPAVALAGPRPALAGAGM